MSRSISLDQEALMYFAGLSGRSSLIYNRYWIELRSQPICNPTILCFKQESREVNKEVVPQN